MGALLDLTVAFIIWIIGMALTNFNVLNTQNDDYYASIRAAAIIKSTIDEAPVTANTTSGTSGLLDNDGATLLINGSTLTLYPGRPLNSTTLGSPTTVPLPVPVNLPGTNSTIDTTLFIAPNHSIAMEDNWTYGSLASPVAGCPHAVLQVGSKTDIDIDCTVGTVTVQNL